MVDGKEAKPRAAEDGHDDGSSDGGRRLQVFEQVATVSVGRDRIARAAPCLLHAQNAATMTAVLMVARVCRCSNKFLR